MPSHSLTEVNLVLLARPTTDPASAAHDGDRTLSVEGNGFRLWSLIGAIAAGVVALGLTYLTKTRRLFKSQNRRLRPERSERS